MPSDVVGIEPGRNVGRDGLLSREHMDASASGRREVLRRAALTWAEWAAPKLAEEDAPVGLFVRLYIDMRNGDAKDPLDLAILPTGDSLTALPLRDIAPGSTMISRKDGFDGCAMTDLRGYSRIKGFSNSPSWCWLTAEGRPCAAPNGPLPALPLAAAPAISTIDILRCCEATSAVRP